MSQKLKEFVNQSGVEITPTSVSTNASNNNFARELETNLLKKQGFPDRLEKNMISNADYGEFSEYINKSNWNNNVNYNNLPNENKRMINGILNDIGPPVPVPIPLLPTTELTFSKLNPGMFNATVNKEFPREGELIDLKKILMRTPTPKTPIGEGLYIDTREIIGRYGAMQEGFSHTREYGKRGNINRKFFTVQFKIIVSNGIESKGATVNLYKNGKIRFSGGFIGTNIASQPELIRRFIVNTYSEKEAFLYNPFEYNNLSGQFRINGNFKSFSSIAGQKQKVYESVGVTKLDFEPELSPFMYVNYKGHKYNFAQTGNVQISGAPSPADMLVAYNNAIELIKIMNANGDIIVTGQFANKFIKGARIPKKRGPKKKIGPRTVVKKSTKKRDPVLNIQINGVQCMRFSKPELVDFAKKLGVVGITQSTKKEEICKKINLITNKKSTTFKNTNKKKNVKLSGSNKDFKVGKSKCMNYDKTELLRVAKILKIQLDEKETKITLCKKIEKARNNMIAPKPKPNTPPTKKVVAEKKKVVRTEQVMKKRGLNGNTIRKDIIKLYGKRWMDRYKNVMPSLNNDIREMTVRLGKMTSGNKMGIPFKKNVDDVKKNIVNKWKRERARNLEKKFIMNSLNVSGIPRNMVTAYKNSATNYILIHKPTNTKFARYKKTWLNNKKNTKNVSPKPLVKAKRETM
jgi:hypothetical protein|tara:strand:+ start:638 stop:2704 length:2067 start_codon:yes stop_codon:yes gene_type:complete